MQAPPPRHVVGRGRIEPLYPDGVARAALFALNPLPLQPPSTPQSRFTPAGAAPPPRLLPPPAGVHGALDVVRRGPRQRLPRAVIVLVRPDHAAGRRRAADAALLACARVGFQAARYIKGKTCATDFIHPAAPRGATKQLCQCHKGTGPPTQSWGGCLD